MESTKQVDRRTVQRTYKPWFLFHLSPCNCCNGGLPVAMWKPCVIYESQPISIMKQKNIGFNKTTVNLNEKYDFRRLKIIEKQVRICYFVFEFINLRHLCSLEYSKLKKRDFTFWFSNSIEIKYIRLLYIIIKLYYIIIILHYF